MIEKQRKISILNDVLGPVMRGPSSSHSAGPYAIAKICRQLSLSYGEKLLKACIRFDYDGSFAQVHAEQGSDEGFAAGLMGFEIESDKYLQALPMLTSPNPPFDWDVEICSLKQVDHPNLVEIVLTCDRDSMECTDRYLAISDGGGIVEILQCNDKKTGIDGSTYVVIVESSSPILLGEVLACFSEEDLLLNKKISIDETSDFWLLKTCRPLNSEERELIYQVPSVKLIREAAPNQLIVTGEKAPFVSAKEVLEMCAEKSLPEIAAYYESEILGIAEDKVEELFVKRAELLLRIVETGLARNPEEASYDFLEPTSDKILYSQTARTLIGDAVNNAISGALTVMEGNTMRGLVCAAPTAGSAGIVPGCLYSLKQAGHPMSVIVDALKVVGVVGAIIGIRATFAAELAGCMVETGSSAAMAAAGLAQALGAPPETVFNAAALPLMNTLGLVCDPVGGSVEVPCYARNIAGVGHAYVSASASIGGFRSFIPFDEAVDTLLKVGTSMHSDLRCTSKGGLAVCPTALKLCR